MMRTMNYAPEIASAENVRKRLRFLRRALGLSQAEFSARIVQGRTAYNNWEKGFRRPTIEATIAICNEFGVDLDYIYLGRLDRTPFALAKAILALPEADSHFQG